MADPGEDALVVVGFGLPEEIEAMLQLNDPSRWRPASGGSRPMPRGSQERLRQALPRMPAASSAPSPSPSAVSPSSASATLACHVRYPVRSAMMTAAETASYPPMAFAASVFMHEA